MGSVQRVVALDKDGKNMGCVYCATNTVNGKKYVGMTTFDLQKRIWEHLKKAEEGSDCYFHKSIRKYGFKVFEWSILITNENEIELFDIEIKLIRDLNTIAPYGYNLTSGGEGIVNPSEEIRSKIMNALTGKRKSESHIKNMRDSKQSAYLSDMDKRGITQEMKNEQRRLSNIESQRRRRGYYERHMGT